MGHRNAVTSLLLLACLGCGGTTLPLPPAWLDADFTPEQVADIRRAAWEWEEATDSLDAHIEIAGSLTDRGMFTVPRDWDDDDDQGEAFEVHRTNTRDPGYQDLRNHGSGVAFCGKTLRGDDHPRVVIVTECPAALDGTAPVRAIIMHEFGHLYGLDHAALGLMVRSGRIDPCIDGDTLEEFCSINGCGPDAHTTCD